MTRLGTPPTTSVHPPVSPTSTYWPSGTVSAGPPDRPRFLSEADCHDVAARLARFAKGGGYTTVQIESNWTGNVRWARNQVSSSGDVRDNTINVGRNLQGATVKLVLINDTSDAALMAATRRAERLASCSHEELQGDLTTRYQAETFTAPNLFSEATYQLDADRRAEVARHLAQSATDAGMLSAGYVQVSAHSRAIIDTLGRSWYFQYTQAQYSVTVRDPKGIGSGWAGVDWHDWSKIDGMKLSAIALDKCLRSRNPVAIEPGRYTTILEPQAVCDFVSLLVDEYLGPLDRESAEYYSTWTNPWRDGKRDPDLSPEAGYSQLGERVIDERITISADPMDPELGFTPFDIWQDSGESRKNPFARPVYHPVTWIENGVLKNLHYDRDFGREYLHVNTGLPCSGAFRMSGGTTSIDEMIATTTRGLLVTRFDGVQEVDGKSVLQRGHTRDGLWLIEKGKISKSVKNLTFIESVLFALNNVEQLGVPQRVFNPVRFPLFILHPKPVIVPPLKIKDFSFAALDDAI